MNNPNLSYNMCTLCGYQPEGAFPRLNFGPVRFWDPDDGWRIGTLCPWCYETESNRTPQPNDYAYNRAMSLDVDIDTDEDPTLALLDYSGRLAI